MASVLHVSSSYPKVMVLIVSVNHQMCYYCIRYDHTVRASYGHTMPSNSQSQLMHHYTIHQSHRVWQAA